MVSYLLFVFFSLVKNSLMFSNWLIREFLLLHYLQQKIEQAYFRTHVLIY